VRKCELTFKFLFPRVYARCVCISRAQDDLWARCRDFRIPRTRERERERVCVYILCVCSQRAARRDTRAAGNRQ